ncbi:GNAT family N-acetyltransferase [Asticcacaulis sp. SL142]|uniref:GNAT family N-acetyltransferase n=1 Tax=Asticcacaulis sp. SL142 TaxID=2995155 RepID=UPI00226CDD0C|nr:GNAT family N-acetyltransferase [Asticcacaulis sp. SL142]WAC46912.1 GNAT family N-acetyltransferase [Asticcacaulis sp. SL142]
MLARFKTKPAEISLRDVGHSDLNVFFAQQQDAEANHMAAFTPRNPSDRIAFDKFWTHIRTDPTILRRTILWEGQIAGSIVSFDCMGVRCVGYWLGREFWGHGIATEALVQFLEIEPKRPLFARIAFDNLASQRVLEKCGFSLIGHDRYYAEARKTAIRENVLRLT